jgi:hypothetical protein
MDNPFRIWKQNAQKLSVVAAVTVAKKCMKNREHFSRIFTHTKKLIFFRFTFSLVWIRIGKKNWLPILNLHWKSYWFYLKILFAPPVSIYSWLCLISPWCLWKSEQKLWKQVRRVKGGDGRSCWVKRGDKGQTIGEGAGGEPEHDLQSAGWHISTDHRARVHRPVGGRWKGLQPIV